MKRTGSRAATHFWFRAEQKKGEHRPLLHPEHVKKLISAGHAVTVEKSHQRIIHDEDYAKIDGVVMAPEYSWKKAPKETVIVGLKELDSDEDADYPLVHRHIYFAHCYKGQKGSEKLLRRFKTGGGSLYDIEFLTDERGVRIASFSNAAGKVGAALAVRLWAIQNVSPSEQIPTLAETYKTYAALTADVKPLLEKAKARAGRTPSLIVVGALGKSGRGAVDVATSLNVDVVKWDMAETARGGPFKEILDNDILINCIYLNPKAPKSAPFLSLPFIEQHQKERKLSVIADVSCDTNNPNNPIPVYNTLTSFDSPTLTIFDKPIQPPLQVIAIDHLPSLVPLESSKDFTNQFIDHMVEFDHEPTWQRALNVFKEKIANV